ncbi:hypothetical protein BDN67DRAFT_1014389 [Paxillus ammoniavirescens]|nr:hypothetical protein BDN67DRAFT_1014389 [Paxillus ammoniavirescens]
MDPDLPTRSPGTAMFRGRETQPPPLHLALKHRVFNMEAWDLITKLVDLDLDVRPEWSETKKYPYFKALDWNCVAARGYNHKPLFPLPIRHRSTSR